MAECITEFVNDLTPEYIAMSLWIPLKENCDEAMTMWPMSFRMVKSVDIAGSMLNIYRTRTNASAHSQNQFIDVG